jgi:tetratricopeptide (TPR) repeat protein
MRPEASRDSFRLQWARRVLRGALTGLMFLAVLALPVSHARATPSPWTLARDPETYNVTRALRRAEQSLIDARREPHPLDDPILPAEIHAARSLDALRVVGGETATNAWVRLGTARGLFALGRYEAAAGVLETVVRARELPESVRSDAWGDLAVAYARIDRVADEIDAYEEGIAREPHAASRAMMLANQAEAFMVADDLPRAISGYRAALGELASIDAASLAPTTLWSLAVALDRSGDLDSALEHVARARSYDPFDSALRGPGWFFVPPYDRHWYEALGQWLVARRGSSAPSVGPSPSGVPGLLVGGARAGDALERRRDAFERGIIAWRLYLAAAPADGPYVPLALARLAQMEREREVVEAEATRHARATSPQPSSSGARSKTVPR